MILAWPILAYLGITMARHMKPALPNGGWFQMHRFLMLTSLLFTCLGFVSIFFAFRNNNTRGLINLGDVVRHCVFIYALCSYNYIFAECNRDSSFHYWFPCFTSSIRKCEYSYVLANTLVI